jgi:integrase
MRQGEILALQNQYVYSDHVSQLGHQFNTYMRGKVDDAKLQQLTGHRTLRMVDNYTHFFLSDFRDVVAVQEQYLQ